MAWMTVEVTKATPTAALALVEPICPTKKVSARL